MKKYLFILLMLLGLVGFSGNSYASSARAYTGYEGTGTGALGKTPCSELLDGDQAWVQTGVDTAFFTFDSTDATAEDSVNKTYIHCYDASWSAGNWILSPLRGLIISNDVQAYDSDLADLADGSLSGGKVGTGISGTNVTTGEVPYGSLPSTVTRNPMASGLNFNDEIIYDVANTITGATPSVAGGTVFKTGNSGATTITNFSGGSSGQIIWVLINDSNSEIDFSGNAYLKGHGGIDWAPSSGDAVTCISLNGTQWNCNVSRPTSQENVSITGFANSEALVSDASGEMTDTGTYTSSTPTFGDVTAVSVDAGVKLVIVSGSFDMQTSYPTNCRADLQVGVSSEIELPDETECSSTTDRQKMICFFNRGVTVSVDPGQTGDRILGAATSVDAGDKVTSNGTSEYACFCGKDVSGVDYWLICRTNDATDWEDGGP